MTDNKYLASKIRPIIKLIEHHELATDLAFIATCQTDGEISRHLALAEELNSVFIELMTGDLAKNLEEVYCALLDEE
ncbi:MULTISPECIES: hypothetical protein [Aerococcus]|uniref:Uncharacterized protein n=1 Tax=Aerococcus sanguinicola TaxID=119206 RepID=A0A5N1GLR1_9LACT|nr:MULTISPECIES: hypothetical protein [Aerococcus]KAA9301933.1 hypothetical protein F6I03_01630 [Aerococcus sanguinicola]MDK6368644.1 hypothetical protein [Aerococcus sp. UMB9870]MDK6679727.1 hypothetical protein [Aerococcus sp. UMB8608]MDK6686001.1 hypothetical protein [Aerococcus sp. UMB8623]MDK6940807.1 hypothetical protein [Aerococcus sp. UMB8487]